MPKTFEISLKEIRAEMGKKKGEEWHRNHPVTAGADLMSL